MYLLNVENIYLAEKKLGEVLLQMLLESNECTKQILDFAERISAQEGHS